jgi:hypothetical protein
MMEYPTDLCFGTSESYKKIKIFEGICNIFSGFAGCRLQKGPGGTGKNTG